MQRQLCQSSGVAMLHAASWFVFGRLLLGVNPDPVEPYGIITPWLSTTVQPNGKATTYCTVCMQ